MDVSGCVKLRVAIVGSSRIRVAKVLSLLDDDTPTSFQQPREIDYTSLPSSTVDDNGDQFNAFLHRHVEYIGCVAAFDTYEDEDGKTIRYLAKIEYHGPNGARVRGSSLAPFFDDTESNSDDNRDNERESKRIPGIAAVAIGCGIESENDIAMIITFLQSMSIHKQVELRLPDGTTKSDATQDGKCENPTIVKIVQPNVLYKSMEDENQAYKNMNLDEKRLVTLNRTVGPGKMANFVQSLANEIAVANHIIPSPSPPPSPPSIIEENTSTDCTENIENHPINHHDDHHHRQQERMHDIKTVAQHSNTNKTQYACKQCRAVLFNEDDLEDPPHAKAQQTFNRGASGALCSSVFLAEGLDWMGDISSMEGKLCCPKCCTKLGLWNWAGAQCSCGTWITPAIKIVLNKVDVILANDLNRNEIRHSCGAGLPPGTIIPKIS